MTEKNAGGMLYQIMKEIYSSHFMIYLEGGDKESFREIFEKNKRYYMASANKTIARLELAQSRVKNIDLSLKEKQLVDDRIFHGLKWLNNLKENIKKAKGRSEFEKAVSYKEWHAVKLIPSAAEGYALVFSLKEMILKRMNEIMNRKKDGLTDSDNIEHQYNLENLENTQLSLVKAEKKFFDLLSLKENHNHEQAEKTLMEAYEEINSALKVLE